MATGIAVDADGNAYVTGHTNATDLPTVHGFQPAAGGSSDGFIAKLNPAGSTLLYSSYLGGTNDDGGDSIALGPDGAAHVAGTSASHDFPVRNPLQGGLAGRNDAIVMKIDTAASGPGSLRYSTYIGGPDFSTAPPPSRWMRPGTPMSPDSRVPAFPWSTASHSPAAGCSKRSSPR